MKHLNLMTTVVLAAILISGCSGSNESAQVLQSKLVSAGKLQLLTTGSISVSSIINPSTSTAGTGSTIATEQSTDTTETTQVVATASKTSISAAIPTTIANKTSTSTTPITGGPDPVVNPTTPITGGPDPVDNGTTPTTDGGDPVIDSGNTYYVTFKSDNSFSVENNGTQVTSGDWMALGGNTLLVVINDIENQLNVTLGNDTLTVSSIASNTATTEANSNTDKKCTWQKYPKTQSDPNPIGGTFVCK